jgi:hypothetical protein
MSAITGITRMFPDANVIIRHAFRASTLRWVAENKSN